MSIRLLKLCISLLYYVLYEVVIARLVPGYCFPVFTVLTYHSVKNGQRAKFERQMDDLLRLVRVVPACIDCSLLGPERNTAVTFDDGFQNLASNAIPVLRERGIPATIFVTTGDIGKRQSWIQDARHPNSGEKILDEIQLKALPGELIMVGSHSVTHARLSRLNEKAATRELSESKRDLERIAGKSIDLFSFPYGDYNERLVELCRKAGYQRVFLNIPAEGALIREKTLYGRIDVSPDDWCVEYRLKMMGAYRWLGGATRLKRYLMRLYPFGP